MITFTEIFTMTFCAYISWQFIDAVFSLVVRFFDGLNRRVGTRMFMLKMSGQLLRLQKKTE